MKKILICVTLFLIVGVAITCGVVFTVKSDEALIVIAPENVELALGEMMKVDVMSNYENAIFYYEIENAAIVTFADEFLKSWRIGETKLKIQATCDGQTAYIETNVKVKASEIVSGVTFNLFSENSSEIKSGEKADGTFDIYKLEVIPNKKFDNWNFTASTNLKIKDVSHNAQILEFYFSLTAGTDFNIEIDLDDEKFSYSNNCTPYISEFNIEISSTIMYLTNEIDKNYPNTILIHGENYFCEMDKKILEIKNGIISPIALGQVTIAFLANDNSGFRKEFAITILEIVAEDIVLNLPSKMVVGEVTNFSFEVIPVFASRKEITFESSKEVKVDNGSITALSKGEAEIKVYLNQIHFKTLNITVKEPIVEQIIEIRVIGSNASPLYDNEFSLSQKESDYVEIEIWENGECLIEPEFLTIHCEFEYSLECNQFLFLFNPNYFNVSSYIVVIEYKGISLTLSVIE